jgi:hypothetical protein
LEAFKASTFNHSITLFPILRFTVAPCHIPNLHEELITQRAMNVDALSLEGGEMGIQAHGKQ